MKQSARTLRGRRRALGGGKLACSVLVAAFLLFSTPIVAPGAGPRAEAAFPGRNGRIVFAASQVQSPEPINGATDLFTVSSSGRGIAQLTSGPEAEFDPSWSPDGRRIAFARFSLDSTTPDIWVMELSDGQMTNLTASPVDFDYFPSWSPDGSKIVFVSEPSNPTFAQFLNDSDIFVMDSDGGNVVALTEDAEIRTDPAWSPQGDVVAYIDKSSVEPGAIRLIRPDGSGDTLVVTTGMELSVLSWSPDGRRITFGTDGGHIWLVNRDGSGLRNLTSVHGGAGELSPSWSPDGKWIAFVSNHDDESTLYKMRPDGSDVTLLVDITITAETLGKTDWGRRSRP